MSYKMLKKDNLLIYINIIYSLIIQTNVAADLDPLIFIRFRSDSVNIVKLQKKQVNFLFTFLRIGQLFTVFNVGGMKRKVIIIIICHLIIIVILKKTIILLICNFQKPYVSGHGPRVYGHGCYGLWSC